MWYVVADDAAEKNLDDKVWTLSESPTKPGWETDSGQPGYGLTYAKAKALADVANAAGI